MCHFVGTSSAEYYWKSNFFNKNNLGLISNSRGIVEKALFVLVRQPAKQVPCLVFPTPPSGCQARGFEISTTNKIK
jgi:hypothetical protein